MIETAQAIEECLEFLQYQLHKRDFGEFSPGEKTMSTLKIGLTHFTVAELYFLIGSSCRYAGDAYVKSEIPKYRGKTRAVSTLRTTIEKARANNWDITPWKRDYYNCPRSSISLTLFSSALHLDDAGFTELIDEISTY
ncbi:MAG: hypothetical protein JJU46_10590 [Balneolaceae bacterium]|nr:hypothetical protein [Balneolaceae bacterium]MCH8548879.1 hypothetical protein [Balneolaceae bacterium]